jgi:parallel beta-helix repeat protein
MSFIVTLSQSQPGNWGLSLPLSFPSNDYDIGGVASDGYGQHLAVTYSSTPSKVYYRLFGNDGTLIWSQIFEPDNSLNINFATVTSYGGIVSLVAGASNPVGDETRVYLFQSTNGGLSWPIAHNFDVGFAPENGDAFANESGVHITWKESEDVPATHEVYHRRRLPDMSTWSPIKHITDEVAGPYGQGGAPKVTVENDNVIISYVATTGSGQGIAAATRDGIISGNDITWDDFVRPTSDASFTPGAQSLAGLGGEKHWIISQAGIGQHLRTAVRQGNNAWSAPTFFASYGIDEDFNHRRKIISYGGSLLLSYISGSDVLFRSNAGSGWMSPFVVQGPGDYRRSTISASRMGTYVFWSFGQSVSQFMRRKVSGLSGSIDENMFWTGNNWLTGTVTIQSGKTVTVKTGSTTNVSANAQIVVSAGANLIIEPGATMKFASGAKIVAEGNLIAQGTQAQPIILRNDITANQWGGIEASGNFTSPTVTLSYVNVSGTSGAGIHIGNTVNFIMQNSSVGGGTIGVEIVPGNSPGLPPPILLTKNTISGANDGFYLYGSSNVSMEENTLIGTGGGSGIACFGSSPTVLRNDIRGFKYGLYCATGSSPMLEKGLMGGNNLITENEYGVYVTGGSSPNLGTIADPSDDGGQNSIFANNAYDVVISGDDMTVMAQNNWWGTPGDPSSQFQINGNSSEVVYYPWLADDPNPGSSLTGGKNSGGEKIVAQGAGNDPIEIPLLMKQAMRERKRSNYAQATALLKAIIANGAMPQFAKQWALSQLLGVAQRMNRPNLPAYLSSISQREFVRRAQSVLPLSHWSEGSTRDAMSAFDANIARYPNSEVACAALYGKFIHALYNAGDGEDAQTLLNRLQREYPQSAEAEFAERQMRNYVGTTLTAGPTGMSKAVAGQGQANPPTEFALEQNYPNPFNPTTTIRYALPSDGVASLKVYDLLGREVASLVEGFKTAGAYEVQLNASSLASGVYVYKLRAGRYVAARKLIVAK